MSDDVSDKLEATIASLGDWRGETLRAVREVVLGADPDVVETWKWVKPTSPGVPVWERSGIICTGETYKRVIKLTFAQGASLPDPHGLFNSSLEGKVRRAIDIGEGEQVDAGALAELVREAIALNVAKRG